LFPPAEYSRLTSSGHRFRFDFNNASPKGDTIVAQDVTGVPDNWRICGSWGGGVLGELRFIAKSAVGRQMVCAVPGKDLVICFKFFQRSRGGYETPSWSQRWAKRKQKEAP
jgi:hypothetical protein